MAAARTRPPVTLLQQVGLTVFLLSISVTLLALQAASGVLKHTRKSNFRRRRALLSRLGLQESRDDRKTIIGFFHPYCNAGGGGERVLFEAIRHHLQSDDSIVCVVYSGDVTASESLQGSRRPRPIVSGSSSIADGGGTATKEEILIKAKDRFDIDLSSLATRIAFLPLKSRRMISDGYWTRLTMLGQSFGSMILAKEACEELLPDYFIDTMGYAFTFPVVRLFKHTIPIGAYVHYPTISTDMLARVKNRQAGHTNDASVSGSPLKSHIKLIYYHLFAMVYGWCLRRADALVVNGTWTQNHINHFTLRKAARNSDGTAKANLHRRDLAAKAEIVYPPCDTRSLEGFDLNGRTNTIVSLAQFRPEKEHSTQLKLLRALFDLRQDLLEREPPVRLVMMGSCRNQEDEGRIEGLKKLAKELDLQDRVEFIVNAPYATILEQLSQASIGLSTMVDEHFGINVVEFMAAGLITLSHASAGPLLDIAVPVDGKPTGFHATNVESFAEECSKIFDLSAEEVLAIRRRARGRARDVFSATAFTQAWDQHLWQRLQRSRR